MYTIVVLTDLSRGCDDTLRLAGWLARSNDAGLHVVCPMDVIGRPLREMLQPLQSGMWTRAEAELREQIRNTLGEGRCDFRLDARDSARAAIEAARDAQADLVVLTASESLVGRRTAIDLARRVAHGARVAVLVVADPHCWPPQRLRYESEGLDVSEVRALAATFGMRTTARPGGPPGSEVELLVLGVDGVEEGDEEPSTLLDAPIALFVPLPEGRKEPPEWPAERDTGGGIAMMPPA